MNEEIIYEHRQIGWVVIAVTVGVIAVISVAHAISERSGDRQLAFNLVIIIAAVTAAIFSSLTIRVTNQSMAWWFGIPVIGRHMTLAVVDAVERASTRGKR